MTMFACYFNSKVYIPGVLEASLATSDHVKLVTRQLQCFVQSNSYGNAVLVTFLKNEKIWALYYEVVINSTHGLSRLKLSKIGKKYPIGIKVFFS